MASQKRGQMVRPPRKPKWMQLSDKDQTKAVTNAVTRSIQSTDVGADGLELRVSVCRDVFRS